MMDIQRDLEEKIKAYPLAAMAIAIGAGALIGLARGLLGGREEAPAKRTITSAVFGGLGAVAMGMIRSAVIEQLSDVAKQWLDPSREQAASSDRSVESFLEH